MNNDQYQSTKQPVQCPYCSRWFKHAGYYTRHDRDSIISCVTRIRIAENDEIERARIKETTSNRPPNYYKKRWYDKNREKILQKKKEWYIENAVDLIVKDDSSETSEQLDLFEESCDIFSMCGDDNNN